MIVALLVFAVMVALDFVWAHYTFAMTSGHILKSGLTAALIILLSGTAQIEYTHTPLMLAPAALGAAVGTMLAVWRKGKH